MGFVTLLIKLAWKYILLRASMSHPGVRFDNRPSIFVAVVVINRILHSWSFNMEFMKLVGYFLYFARQGSQNKEINQLIS